MDESVVVKAVDAWCSASFAAAVRESGAITIHSGPHLVMVAAVRRIYERRLRMSVERSPAAAIAQGVLSALESIDVETFRMIPFQTGSGIHGLVLTTIEGRPIFALPLTRRFVTPPGTV